MRYWYSVEGLDHYFHDFAPARFHHFVSINRVSHLEEWKRISARAYKTDNNLTQKPKKGEENLRIQTLRYRIIKYTVNDAVVDWMRKNVQCGQKEAQWGTYLSNGTQIDVGFRHREDALKFLMWWAEGIEPAEDYNIIEVAPKSRWIA
jgi:hypothetical protein